MSQLQDCESSHRQAEQARELAIQLQDFKARGLKQSSRMARRFIKSAAEVLIRRRYYEAINADREVA